MRMRKISLLLLFATILAGFSVSCSSDEDYFYEQDENAKLQYTKNLILSYGQKYGLKNIQFDDDLLKKNLDLPKEEYEKSMISMAISLGTTKPSSKLIRKMRRSQTFGGEEPGEVTIPHYKIDGSFSNSESKDGIDLDYSIHYRYDSFGYWGITGETAKAEKVIKDSSGNVVSILSSGGRFIKLSLNTFIVDVTFSPGAKVPYTITYDANIVNDGSDLVYSFELENKFVAGIAEAVSF